MTASHVPTQTLTIEVWSDIACPFCYLGKLRLEAALAAFEHRGDIELRWRSFLLNPALVTDPGRSLLYYLAEATGLPREQLATMNSQVAAGGAEVGIDFHFDRVVLANTLQAHRFVHWATAAGRGPEALHALFRAYFTDGRNVDDHDTLRSLAAELGLDADDFTGAMAGGAYRREVEEDLLEAQRLGIRGVPFFVLDRRYGVSGAQEPETLLQAIRRAHADWRNGPTA